MKVKNVKISFNTLVKKKHKVHTEEPFDEVLTVLKFIMSIKDKKERQMDLKENKFMRLENIKSESKDKNIVTGIFKSAKYTYRPNLLDKTTGEERSSPKKFSEGEAEKTHFAIKKTNDEVFLLLEINGNGVTINQVLRYLNQNTKHYKKSINETKPFSLKYYKMGKDDFKEQIKRMNRVRTATVYYDKKILGNNYLNFSNRTSSIQRNLEITIKAEKSMDIKEPLLDIANKFASKENKKNGSISKVRIAGKDENGTPTIIDTSFIERVDSTSISLNPTTGQIETTEAYSNLLAFIKQL